jgi:hypothetical protein
MNKKKEIKKVIEQILGSNITMRDDKPPEDMLKEEFVNIIEKYEGIWKRQNDLLENQGIDFSSYDDDYFKVIEGWLIFALMRGRLMQFYFMSILIKMKTPYHLLIKMETNIILKVLMIFGSSCYIGQKK